MRPLGIAALWLLVAALAGSVMLGFGSSARAALRLQDGTPAASPAAQAPAETDLVTIVASYLPDATGNLLVLRPLDTDDDAVADLSDEEGGIGTVDFAAIGNDLPRITLGESTFDAYIRYEGDLNGGLRWTWFFDEPNVRPATLVVQIAGTAGPYNQYNGTATFISRAENAGGVLVLAINPPEGAAAETPAVEIPAVETPAADTPAAETPAADDETETPAADDETPAPDDVTPTDSSAFETPTINDDADDGDDETPAA